MIRSTGRTDLPGHWLEFFGMEDMVEGEGEERVVPLPGGLVTPSPAAVAEGGRGGEFLEER